MNEKYYCTDDKLNAGADQVVHEVLTLAKLTT